MMYEKAKEDKTFRTDIPEEFNWYSKEDTDYTLELIKLKEMILAYATLKK